MVSRDGHGDITHQLKELNERISDTNLQLDRMCSILIELFDKTKERLPVDDGLAKKRTGTNCKRCIRSWRYCVTYR